MVVNIILAIPLIITIIAMLVIIHYSKSDAEVTTTFILCIYIICLLIRIFEVK